MRAIVLFSGGLDSTLAARILQEQGIGIVGLNFVTPFHDNSQTAQKAADGIGIELVVHQTGDDYIQLVAKPRFGYGKAVNPCIDCRIEMCRVAKMLMAQREAVFTATGEIAGQRPNSQMQHQLNLIDRESGLDGFLLRPLSAQVLSPTKTETNGIVDRRKLFGYTGRGRGRLIALAHRLGIKKIPQPSTGCFLCEKSYAPKVFDLFNHESNPTNWDAEILNAGRQVRISPTLKIVLSRNEEQGKRLEQLFDLPDARPAILMIPESFNGPTAMLIDNQFCEQINKQVDEQRVDRRIDDYFKLGGNLILQYTNPAKYNPQNAIVRIRFSAFNPSRENNPLIYSASLF
jgi:hypothetical protein